MEACHERKTHGPSPFAEHNFSLCWTLNALAFVRSVTTSGGPGADRKSWNASRPGTDEQRSFGKLLVTGSRRQENTGKDILPASILWVITQGHFCNEWPVTTGTAPDGHRQIPGPSIANFSSARGQKKRSKTPREWPWRKKMKANGTPHKYLTRASSFYGDSTGCFAPFLFTRERGPQRRPLSRVRKKLELSGEESSER